MHLDPNSVACAMRAKHNGAQGRRARSARYAECVNVVCAIQLASLTRRVSLLLRPPPERNPRPRRYLNSCGLSWVRAACAWC